MRSIRLAGRVDQHFGASKSQRPRHFGKIHVVAEQTAELADGRIDDREKTLSAVLAHIVGVAAGRRRVRRMALDVGSVVLTVAQDQVTVGSDDKGAVEPAIRPLWIVFHGAAGDVHFELLRRFAQRVGLGTGKANTDFCPLLDGSI